MRPKSLLPLVATLLCGFASTQPAHAQPASPAPGEAGAGDAPQAPPTENKAAPKAPDEAPSAPAQPPAPPAAEEPEEAAPAEPKEAAPAEPEPSEAEMAAAEAEAEAAADADLAKDANAFSKPPKKGMAVIWGVVKDSVEHDTVPEAQVSINGTKYKTFADYDGRYRLELPPGVYSIRVYVELHRPSLVRNITVKAGEIEKIDVDVLPDEQAVDTVEVVTDVDKSSTEGQLLTRQRSASVGDGVGRAEISRTPASNAAQAAQRVVGATIVGNRFVYVRGLGERYTNALLNGAPLPSPEPDRAAIPLDLFPSLTLESINIVKTFTPDIPGDFAGGSVQITTREIPTKPLFQVSIGLGYDTNSTLRDRLAQKSSSTDWLGTDGGLRGYPSGFPSYALASGQPKPGGGKIGQQDVLAAGRLLNSSMNPNQTTSLPNYSLGVVAGRGWNLGGERRLGAMAAINYGRSFKRYNDIIIRQYQPDIQENPDGSRIPYLRTSLDHSGQRGIDKVNWGAFGSVSYWASQQHRFTLLGMHTQLADSSAQLLQGRDEAKAAEIATVNLRYVSRALNVLQVRGEDDFKSLNRAELRWYGSYAVAARNEPNTRDTVYAFDPDDVTWDSIEKGAHFYSSQNEKTKGAGLDWTQPLLRNSDDLKLKVGGLVSGKDRNFSARRFLYEASAASDVFACPGASYSIDCPVPVYQYGNVGTKLNFREDTQADDAYKATQNIYSGFLMLDATALKKLRFVGGARVERTDQRIDPYSQFSGGMPEQGAKINSTDWLPALSVAYSATKRTKLRAAVSQTLARPQTRELAPFVFADYFGAYPIKGEPDLKLTYIRNVDLRFEAFPTPTEVLAFSIFFKDFKDPIEPYIVPSGTPGLISYQNAKGANLIGLELEARKNLAFLSKALKDLSFIGNLTLTKSRIQLDPDLVLQNSTNRSRAMVNQAPYVINLALDYANPELGLDARLLYNVIGPRIVQVGTGGLDDTYGQPLHTLDATISKQLVKHVQLKLIASNLFDARLRETVGKVNRDDRVTYQQFDGRIFTLQASYTH